MAIGGGTLAVGAHYHDDLGSDSGLAYIYCWTAVSQVYLPASMKGSE